MTSASAGATARPRPSGTPTPSKVPGYGYMDPTPEAQAEFNRMLGSSQGAYTGLSARAVTRGGRRVGHLYLVRLKVGPPQSIGAERALLSAVLGNLTGQGTSVTISTVRGHQIARVRAGRAWFFAWQTKGDLAVYHGGPAEAQALAFAGHYLSS